MMFDVRCKMEDGRVLIFSLQTSAFRLQKLFYFLEAGGYLLLVVEEVGADEHEGGELDAVLGVVLELDIGVLIEETEALLVDLVQLLGAFLAMEMAEELDELVLEMGDNGVLKELGGLWGVKTHIREEDAGDCHAHLVLEHREDNGEKDLAVSLTDLLDYTITAFHGATDNGDLVALANFIGGLTIDYLEVITFDNGLETLYLGIADLYGVAFLITIGVEAVAQHAVPGGVEDTLDGLLGFMDKDEVVEVAAQGLLIEHGVIVVILVVLAGAVILGFPLAELQVFEGDEIVEGGQGAGVITGGIVHL